MLDYIDEVNKNVSIEEGNKTIENILITIYFKEGISTKEFIKKGLIIQDRGIRLTIKGRHFIEEQLGNALPPRN